MCLFTKQILPRRTSNYITVYKVVKIKSCSKHKKYRFFTPVMKQTVYLYQDVVAIGRKKPRIVQHRYLYFDKFMLQYRRLCHLIPNRKPDAVVYAVEDGYIHCCPSVEHAQRWIKKNSSLFPSKKWGILKCIVPKNTLYFKSYDGAELCVRTLKPIKVVLCGS